MTASIGNSTCLKLFGLKKYFLDFVELYNNNYFPKVILISGNKGIGKFTLAFHLVNYFLSTKTKYEYDLKNMMINKESDYFGNILNGTNENLVHIKNDNEKKITIDEIRNIKKKFNSSLMNKKPRFTIIDDVELLSKNIANSLLKFIEEPSKNNYFILINNNRYELLETIKSRAIEFKIFLNNNEKKDILKKLIQYYDINIDTPEDFQDFDTPGMILNLDKNLKKLNISLNDSFYNTASILLKDYKKNKNQFSLECLNFLIEINLRKKLNNSESDLIKLIDYKNNIIKLIHNFKKFNLSSGTVLEYIKEHKEYAT